MGIVLATRAPTLAPTPTSTPTPTPTPTRTLTPIEQARIDADIKQAIIDADLIIKGKVTNTKWTNEHLFDINKYNEVYGEGSNTPVFLERESVDTTFSLESILKGDFEEESIVVHQLSSESFTINGKDVSYADCFPERYNIDEEVIIFLNTKGDEVTNVNGRLKVIAPACICNGNVKDDSCPYEIFLTRYGLN